MNSDPLPLDAPIEPRTCTDMLDALPNRVALIDGSGTLRAANRAWMLDAGNAGDSSGALGGFGTLGASYLDFLRVARADHPDAIHLLRGIESVLTGQVASFSHEYPQVASDEAVWKSMEIRPLPKLNDGVVLMESDISLSTQRQRALQISNKRLERLSMQVLALHEEEKRAISRELHDDLGQTLTALKISLHVLASELGGPPNQRLSSCVEVAAYALNRLREMSIDLHPPQLDQLGLPQALQWVTQRHAAETGLPIRCEIDPEVGPLSTDIELACFRITQEAISNATRHARATHLAVELRRSGADVTLVIEDDGIGFDPLAAHEQALKRGGLGLISMQERAQLAGGTLDVRSVVGEGTSLTAHFLLSAADTATPSPTGSPEESM